MQTKYDLIETKR